MDLHRLTWRPLLPLPFPFQAEKIRAQLASLPPLHVPRLPSRDAGRPEVLSTALYRKTDQLLETLLQMSANVKVVDVTGKSPGTNVRGSYRLSNDTFANALIHTCCSDA